MAQALLNNLNTVTTDGIYSSAAPQDTATKFDSILDTQTTKISILQGNTDNSKNTKNTKNTENTKEIKNTTNTECTKDNTITEDTITTKSIDNAENTDNNENTENDCTIIQNLNITVETLDNILKETELTAAIEYVVDTISENVSEDEEIITEEKEDCVESENNTEVKNTTTEDNDTTTVSEEKEEEEEEEKKDTIINNNNSDKINTNNNTITEEDSTMNTKLKPTLENPTTVIMPLTSQKVQSLTQESSLNETTNFANDTALKAQVSKLIIPESDKTQNKTDSTEQRNIKDLINEEIVKELNIKSVNGTSTQSETDIMQQQTPQEQAIKVMLHEDIKFEDIKLVSAEKTLQQATAGKILEQITKQMEGMQNNSRINMVLNPEHLGKVALKIINSKEGLLAQFTVTNPDTQNILLKGITGLKESLLAQGINVDNVVIKLDESDMSEDEYNPDWTEQENEKNRHQGQDARKNKHSEKNFEQTMFEIENE